ncbi:hypothetical protein, partial [Paraburkholderia unamae]
FDTLEAAYENTLPALARLMG